MDFAAASPPSLVLPDLSQDARALLANLPDASPEEALAALIAAGLDDLPMPGAGATLQRWQVLAAVAEHDLSLVKLYEGHTDAAAILHELGAAGPGQGERFGVWAAEPPQAKARFRGPASSRVRLHGRKMWCSGADHVSHALLTAWSDDDEGPFLARMAMHQPGVRVVADGWHAIGMAASTSLDIELDGAQAELVGAAGSYVARPGFDHGGAGIAACWYGGTVAIASALRAKVRPEAANGPHLLAALGAVDVELHLLRALMRQSAAWIDAHPEADAAAVALRLRAAADAAARATLDIAGRALGAGPFCRDRRFARMAADLPVFIRQTHGESDLAALGQRVLPSKAESWQL